MGIKQFLSNLWGAKASSEVVTSNVGLYDIAFSDSGEPVNDWTALSVGTVLQCISVLCNGVSQVPFRLMQEKGERKIPAKTHPLYQLLASKPNPWQTSFDFRQTLMLWLALRGEVAVWVVRVRGIPKYLVPFSPHEYTTTVVYEGGWAKKTYYFMRDDGSTVAVPESDVWELRWQPFSRRSALPKLDLIRNTIGVALAQNKHASSMLKNGARFPGIITARSQLTNEQRESIQKAWTAQTTGENANKTPVLGADLVYQQTAQTATDAQYIQNRQFQIQEICRFFGVNPFMVFQYENNNSYASSEQFMLQHLTHTLSPIYTMIEQSADAFLLSDNDRADGYYFMFNDSGLLRTDAKTRAEVNRIHISSGVLTPNEVRALEDRDPMEGGDELIIQGAMVPLKDAGKWNNPDAGSTQNENAEDPSAENKE